MKIAIVANEALKNELILKGSAPDVEMLWLTTTGELLKTKAEVYMDLLFVNEHERIHQLASLLPKPVFVNSVTYTLKEIGQPFIRLNAWPGFLKRSILEIAVEDKSYEEMARQVLLACKWPCQVVHDVPGMISARVVSMIINEAYFALEQGVSTKNEIDIAMKLGTNYPLGPFEWIETIGHENIYELLCRLREEGARYEISAALIKEMTQDNVKYQGKPGERTRKP